MKKKPYGYFFALKRVIEWPQNYLLRVMKLTVLLLTTALLQVSARGITQTVTINLKEATIEQFLKSVQKQTGYSYAFSADIMGENFKVSISATKLPLQDALKLGLQGMSLTYSIKDKTIIIQKSISGSEQMGSVSPAMDITGRVLAENGDPVTGATVALLGNKNVSTVTDNNGDFRIQGVEPNSKIQITSIGFEAQTITCSVNKHILVKLIRKVSTLDETLIIAYGTTTQRFNVGSVSKVTSKEIEQQPVTDPLLALQGRVPGLVVTQSSGLPGASVQIQIRGQNSLPANGASLITAAPLDNPLFIIDGVPFAPQNANLNQMQSALSPGGGPGGMFNNAYGGISPFGTIDPASIESIEVLRDADATSIYGSRGSNGVIIITTKKAKAGKTSLVGNVWSGISYVSMARMPSLMNTQQYLQMRKEAFKNDGVNPSVTNDPDLLVFDSTKYTDWKKYFIGNTTHSTNANLSLSAGSSKTNFLLGFGYHIDSKNLFPGDFAMKKASVNLSVHHSSDDNRLLLDVSASYSYSKNNTAGNSTALQAFTLPPNYPDLLDNNENLVWKYKNTVLNNNPVSYLRTPYNAKTSILLSNVRISYKILDGLSVKANLGYNKTYFDEYSAYPKAAQNPYASITSYAYFATNQLESWILEPQLEYTRKIFKGNLTALVGSTFQKSAAKALSLQGSNYSDDALLESIYAAGTKSVTSDGNTLYKYSAVFGRINYVMMSRYILNLNARRDGSSRFGPGRQFGNFGSAGIGWLFSEENFVKNNLPFLSYGKLRATYGTTGSDAIGDYQYLSFWAPTSLSYQGQVGYSPSNLYKPDFSWTVNKKFEAGLELGFLNDRIILNATWYRNRCGNQLINNSLPIQTGFSSVVQNFNALVENKGWEILVNLALVRKQKFNWNTSINLTVPKNKLISFPGLDNSSFSYTYVIGQSLGVLQRVKYLGINDSSGLFQFQTSKGETTYSPNTNPVSKGGDAINIGKTDPKYYGGLQNSFSYNGFQLDFLLQFTKQYGPNYLQQIYANANPGTAVNQPIQALDRWQERGDHATFQKYSRSSAASSAATNFTYSDGSFGDASFIRCKNISLSYNFRHSVLRKLKVNSCKLYVNAQNIFTISRYVGDPETRSFYGVPPLRVIVAGVQILL